MQGSKLAKTFLKYLPILVVLAATVMGLLIGKDLYLNSLDTRLRASTPRITETNNLQPLIDQGTVSPCSALYLSLPPKCKTFDGKFIPVPGTSPYILMTPERK